MMQYFFQLPYSYIYPSVRKFSNTAPPPNDIEMQSLFRHLPYTPEEQIQFLENISSQHFPSSVHNEITKIAHLRWTQRACEKLVETLKAGSFGNDTSTIMQLLEALQENESLKLNKEFKIQLTEACCFSNENKWIGNNKDLLFHLGEFFFETNDHPIFSREYLLYRVIESLLEAPNSVNDDIFLTKIMALLKKCSWNFQEQPQFVSLICKKMIFHKNEIKDENQKQLLLFLMKLDLTPQSCAHMKKIILDKEFTSSEEIQILLYKFSKHIFHNHSNRLSTTYAQSCKAIPLFARVQTMHQSG